MQSANKHSGPRSSVRSTVPTRLLCLTAALMALPLVRFAWSGVRAQPEPVFGLSLAYPREVPVFQEGDSLFRRSEDEYSRLLLSINQSGSVTNLVVNGVVSEARLLEYTSFFEKYRFRPGSRNGSSMAQTLPVTIYLFADHRPPVVTTPIGADGKVGDPGLYWQALELNGVTLPHLQRFPSYHSTLSGPDSTPELRYVLASLDLNPEGVPSRISVARTNHPAFAGQILNAVNWGKYSPGRIDTQAVASSCFILVTFFPSLQYPTQPWKAGVTDTVLSPEGLAVRMLPDTVGCLSGPIPRFAKDWTYPLSVKPGSWQRHGIFRYKIDNRGDAYLISGGNGSEAAWQFGSSLAAILRFYSALDTRGNPVPFEGVVNVTPTGKSNIRVQFLWLQ